MCKVLLGLFLLINKEGRTGLFLARAYVGHKNAERGEHANLPHSLFKELQRQSSHRH